MEFLRAQGYKLSYKDVLQLDGAFSAAHINYGKSPEFNGVDSKNVAKNSRKNSIIILKIFLKLWILLMVQRKILKKRIV